MTGLAEVQLTWEGGVKEQARELKVEEEGGCCHLCIGIQAAVVK